jgi:hypothetical protein
MSSVKPNTTPATYNTSATAVNVFISSCFFSMLKIRPVVNIAIAIFVDFNQFLVKNWCFPYKAIFVIINGF